MTLNQYKDSAVVNGQFIRNARPSAYPVRTETGTVPASSPYVLELSEKIAPNSVVTATLDGVECTVVPYDYAPGVNKICVDRDRGLVKFSEEDAGKAFSVTYAPAGTNLTVSKFEVLLPGPAGPQGSAGPQGPQGTAGVQGPAGSTGPQGSSGPQGSAGPQGATGSQGPQGLTGSTGPQGVAGPQGATGSQGATGFQGATGSQGSAGPQGATGSSGPQGVAGAQGATGAQGSQGVAGSVGTLDDLTDVALSGAQSNKFLRNNGTSWVDASISGADVTTGTLPDARLSSNVPLKNTVNTFTQAITIDKYGTQIILKGFASQATLTYEDFDGIGLYITSESAMELSASYYNINGYATIYGGSDQPTLSLFAPADTASSLKTLFLQQPIAGTVENYALYVSTGSPGTTLCAYFEGRVYSYGGYRTHGNVECWGSGVISGNGSGITTLSASNVSSGTLADARLSSNVPLKNAANTFSNTLAVTNRINAYTLGVGSSSPTPTYLAAFGHDLGSIGMSGGSSTVIIGNTGNSSCLGVGQSNQRQLQFRWDYNATAANAVANLVTWGYSNPLKIDASYLDLNTSSNGAVTVGTGGLVVNGNVSYTASFIKRRVRDTYNGGDDGSADGYGSTWNGHQSWGTAYNIPANRSEVIINSFNGTTTEHDVYAVLPDSTLLEHGDCFRMSFGAVPNGSTKFLRITTVASDHYINGPVVYANNTACWKIPMQRFAWWEFYVAAAPNSLKKVWSIRIGYLPNQGTQETI